MNDIELNDDVLLSIYDRKNVEMSGKELISVKYYFYDFPDKDYIYFDIKQRIITIHSRIIKIEVLNCIMEIGKKLNILKEEEEK